METFFSPSVTETKLDVAAIKLNDHLIIHAVLENSGLLEKKYLKGYTLCM